MTKIDKPEEMKKLLDHAKNNIPYYSKILKDADTNDVEKTYALIPFQNKAMMRDNIEYINPNIDTTTTPMITKVTGGTTGEPWNITKTESENVKYFRMLWRSRQQYGVNPGDHFYQFGGYGEIDGVFTTKKVIVTPMFTELSMFHLNDEVLDEYIELINRGDGNWFFANPSALYYLALRMKERNIKGLGAIKYIELTGERVYDYQKKLISEVFDCPISIMYGSREITTISHQCKYGRHHILPKVFVDVVDDEGNSIEPDGTTMGEVVVTSYVDKYMPFIKYRTGDFAIVGETTDCPCGVHGKCFSKLEGRVPAYVNINGNVIHMEIAYYLMDKFNRTHGEGVNHFQVIFRKPNIFHFKIVPTPTGDRDIIREFYIRELKEAVKDCEVEVEFVKYIERDRRKLNPFVVEE